MPAIAEQIGGLDLFSLAFVAGTFGGVLCSPIAGGLSDRMDRKTLFLFAAIGLSVCQLLHAFMPSMILLVVLRFFTSAFSSICLVTGLGIIGLIFPGKERVRWLGFYGTVSALGSFLGPLVGSFLAVNFGWKFFFYLSPILGLISVIVVGLFMPSAKIQTGKAKLDAGGITTYAILIVSVLILFNFGGKMFAWFSPVTALLIVFIIAFVILFIRVERKQGDKALMPLSLFGNRQFTSAFLGQLLATGCKIPFYLYIQLYMQKVLGFPATTAAIIGSLLAIMAVVASLVFAQFASKTGLVKQSAFAAVLVLTAIAFICLLAGFFSFYSLPFIIVLAAIFGCASTMTNTVFMMIIQTTMPKEVIGIATGNTQLAMSLGSMLPASVYGMIINVYGADLNMGITMTYLPAVIFGLLGLFCISMIKMPKKTDKTNTKQEATQ